jgi:hypothetical protein
LKKIVALAGIMILGISAIWTAGCEPEPAEPPSQQAAPAEPVEQTLQMALTCVLEKKGVGSPGLEIGMSLPCVYLKIKNGSSEINLKDANVQLYDANGEQMACDDWYGQPGTSILADRILRPGQEITLHGCGMPNSWSPVKTVRYQAYAGGDGMKNFSADCTTNSTQSR